MLDLRLNGWTYRAIGKLAGISGQRVQQVLSPPRAVKQHIYDRFQRLCNRCSLYVGESGHIHHGTTKPGIDDYNDIANLELLCRSCHRQAHGPYSGHYLLYPNDPAHPVCPRCNYDWKPILAQTKECPQCHLAFIYPDHQPEKK